jgi:RND family efflux transporter MFP subunit
MSNRHESLGIHGLQSHAAAHHLRRLTLLKRTHLFAAIGVLLLGAGALSILGQRAAQSKELQGVTAEGAKIYVVVAKPQTAKSQNGIELPGTLQGYIESPIFARTSGYVTHWYKDLGQAVKKGDALLDIATPEIEQQLTEARATRRQIEQTVQLARTSFERWKALRQKDAVSQQELDERQTTLKSAEASLNASQANVQRLEDLLSYNHIAAPFSGIVTKRLVDVGHLVDAGNGGAPKALYTLAQIDQLRIFVAAPQTYSQMIKVGIPAEVRLSELPGEVFKAKVVRTAGAIDTSTRTLPVEVNLANPKGQLLPGAYAQVTLKGLKVDATVLTIPNNALLFRPEGTQLALVKDNKVHLQTIKISRDMGQRLEVASGLTPDDAFIINPPDSITEGDVVVVKAAPTPAAAPGTPPAKAGGAS